MKNEMLSRFGSNVRKLRLEKEFSQEELADRAECHRNYVGGVERGERNPTITVVLRLASALECTIAQLFEGIFPSKKDND